MRGVKNCEGALRRGMGWSDIRLKDSRKVRRAGTWVAAESTGLTVR
jgi:hypothetical protein